jgi:drug/metabolite transporter (DMT)-like permease
VAALAGSLLSYSLILEAFRTAPASYVVAVRQTSVLFALLFAAGWLRERPDRRRIFGATATVVGVALIALLP